VRSREISELIEASPTVWRRWLASELRRMRGEAGLEQKQVAQALRCTVTKVSYFENAQRPVVPRDLDEILLPLYSVPPERWPEYLDAAEQARRKSWWEDYPDDVLPEWFGRFVGFEQGADELRTYEAHFVAGLLQVPAYTAALMRSGHTALTDDQIARSVELRTRRQAVVFRDANPLRCWAVLDEAVLRRAAGGPHVMTAQLEHLVEAARRPNVTLQVLPFSRGAHPGSGSGFTILSFPWPTDPGVVYLESGWSAGVYLEEPHEIEDHRQIFERLCDLALDPDASIALLRDLAKEYAA
jgi:transcriptional regulator with XRE-family HTH domain